MITIKAVSAAVLAGVTPMMLFLAAAPIRPRAADRGQSVPETSWDVTTFGGLPAVASGTEWNVNVGCRLAEPGGTSTMSLQTTKVF
jgi:hypothetical protein